MDEVRAGLPSRQAMAWVAEQEDEEAALREAVEGRVALGADRLDGYWVEWWEQIDLSTFDIDSCARCTLGQLFGDYSDGLTALRMEVEEARRLGFTAGALVDPEPGEGSARERLDAEWKLLQVAWRKLIAERQGVGA